MSDLRKKKKLPNEIKRSDAVRIFIVEDEAVVVMGLEDALKRLGYAPCGSAESGEEALARIEAQRPDLVLVDINLDGAMDGIELAESILDSHAIPVIYLTAYSNREIFERAKRTNPFGYIVKPFRERQLKVDIELALTRYNEEKERRAHLANCRNTMEELDHQLRDRTLELREVRADLELATGELELKEIKLDELRREVQEINKALLSVTNHLTRTRVEFELEVAVAVRARVLPILKQLQSDPHFKQYWVEFEMLTMQMNQLSRGLTQKSETVCTLSATELRIAALIKNDFTNDQIAGQLYVSPETIKTHRKNIRKKLGIENPRINLATHLKAQWADDHVSLS